MLYGEILSKFILYVYILSKHQRKIPRLGREFKRVLDCIESLLRNIETELILTDSAHAEGSSKSVVDEIEQVWDDTYNYVLPLLVLKQLSAPLDMGTLENNVS
jgi:hypothetical protein